MKSFSSPALARAARVTLCAALLTRAFSGAEAFAQEPAPDASTPAASDTTGSPAGGDAPQAPSESNNSPSAESDKGEMNDDVVVDDEPNTEGHGLLGPYRVGAAVGFGVPDLLHYGLESRFFNIAGLSAHMGGFSRKVSDIEVKSKNWNLLVRWFPFQGSFFLGSGIGGSQFDASYKREIEITVAGTKQKVPVKFKGEIKRTNVPLIGGWQWLLGPGFLIGLDAGWQLAMGAKASYSVEPEGASAAQLALVKQQKEYKDADTKVRDELDKVKGRGLPIVSLNLGWML